eukprot:g20476.t1
MRSPAIPPRDVPLPFRKRPVPAEPGVEDEAVEWVDEVIAEFEAGDFLHVMEGLLDMREAALCSFSEGGLSESGKKRLCHGLATICSQRAGPNSWLHGGSGGVVSVNRFAALVSERLPVELQRLVAMALWKKGKVEVLVPENHCLRNVVDKYDQQEKRSPPLPWMAFGGRTWRCLFLGWLLGLMGLQQRCMQTSREVAEAMGLRRIFYINLARRDLRRRRFEEQAEALGLGSLISRFPAVDGQTLDLHRKSL